MNGSTQADHGIGIGIGIPLAAAGATHKPFVSPLELGSPKTRNPFLPLSLTTSTSAPSQDTQPLAHPKPSKSKDHHRITSRAKPSSRLEKLYRRYPNSERARNVYSAKRLLWRLKRASLAVTDSSSVSSLLAVKEKSAGSVTVRDKSVDPSTATEKSVDSLTAREKSIDSVDHGSTESSTRSSTKSDHSSPEPLSDSTNITTPDSSDSEAKVNESLLKVNGVSGENISQKQSSKNLVIAQLLTTNQPCLPTSPLRRKAKKSTKTALETQVIEKVKMPDSKNVMDMTMAKATQATKVPAAPPISCSGALEGPAKSPASKKEEKKEKKRKFDDKSVDGDDQAPGSKKPRIEAKPEAKSAKVDLNDGAPRPEKNFYAQRAWDMLDDPLGYDDLVHDDPRPGQREKIMRRFKRFRSRQRAPPPLVVSGGLSVDIKSPRPIASPKGNGQKRPDHLAKTVAKKMHNKHVVELVRGVKNGNSDVLASGAASSQSPPKDKSGRKNAAKSEKSAGSAGSKGPEMGAKDTSQERASPKSGVNGSKAGGKSPAVEGRKFGYGYPYVSPKASGAKSGEASVKGGGSPKADLFREKFGRKYTASSRKYTDCT